MTAAYDMNWLTSRFENGEHLEYLFFWGHSNKQDKIGKSCLSQWYESSFTVDNILYHTAEHWMMAHKALLFNDADIFEKIIHEKKPGAVKELGRNISGYNDDTWNEKKMHIVTTGNIHKFNQHPLLAEFLVTTGSKIIVEASPFDTVWGIGLAQDSKDISNIYTWRGQNLLGFALMAARDFFNKFGHFSPLPDAVQPPWTKYPGIDKADMFWRMGTGEDYMETFDNYYDALGEREKNIYQLTNPEPFSWAGFYK